MTEDNIVIVGGRCAGAALAIHLARAGASVAVLDADEIGTDQVISTHLIHPGGMDLLDDLGVGEAVRAGSPPARAMRFEVDGAFVIIQPPAGRHECCPRRYRLDRLLQEEAAASGAEFLDKTRVTELIFDGERVVGVRATRSGRTLELRGRITVGADGRHSKVAALVGAEEYLAYDSPRAMFWSYWEPPPAWHTATYPFDVMIRFDGDDRRVIFSTDDGQLLLGTMPPIERARRWRSDLETEFLSDLRADPQTGPLVQDGKMLSKVLGTVSERFYFRRSAGPGWALVGDAGHHKDPIVGWGISEALEQAKHLAEAIQTGSSDALRRYWRQRDVDSLPRFRLAEERGGPGRLNPLMRVIIGRLSNDPALIQRLFKEVEFGTNPYELLPMPRIGLWTLGEVLRGHPRRLLDFSAEGRRAWSVAAEVRQRRRLLEAPAA